MTRVLGVLAALLWVAGIVVVGLGALDLLRDVAARSASLDPDSFTTSYRPVYELLAGIVLVGVAGLMTAGLVLMGRGR